VSANLATLGVALRVCTLPGRLPSDRLGPGEMEVGLGIHGGLLLPQGIAFDITQWLFLLRV
jgi:dihydroxyacetone kinase